MNIDLVMDLQYGSTGKGLIAGWLAKRQPYTVAVCAFATNAGHTYIDESAGVHLMTQQLPTSIICPTVKYVLLGPGSAIHAETLIGELMRYAKYMNGKRLMIHPQAAVVESYHADFEVSDGRTKMGSTGKGIGEAYIERIRRRPDNNTVGNRWRSNPYLGQFVVTEKEYQDVLEAATHQGVGGVIVEGAQGFGLSLYHGQYPFVTSRDVTPWQVCADCAIPFRLATCVRVIGTLRTFPIRVNNRDGSSGPCYPDQEELRWDDIGVDPELTTVTKLPRRIFSFSHDQLAHALFHCASLRTELFLNFANYVKNEDDLADLVTDIEVTHPGVNVRWLGYGPDDSDVADLSALE
jgi:adenylosuccinate synthase